MTEINSLHPATQIPTERVPLVSRPETDDMERRAADNATKRAAWNKIKFFGLAELSVFSMCLNMVLRLGHPPLPRGMGFCVQEKPKVLTEE